MTPESLQLQALLISGLTLKEWASCRTSTMAMLDERFIKHDKVADKVAFMAARDVLACKVQRLNLLASDLANQQLSEHFE